MKWLVNSALTEYFFFFFREINRLDYQPLFGKMSPHSSPPEGAAGRVRFPLLVSANHVTTCRFSSGKDCRNETRSAELAIIISYPTSASGIIVLLKTQPKYREFSPTLFFKTIDFQLVFNFEQTRTVTIFGEHGIINNYSTRARLIWDER